MKLEENGAFKNNLVAVLDQAIAQGKWDGSLFFSNIEKRLHHLRHHVLQELKLGQAYEHGRGGITLPLAAGYTEMVYVSIYQADGSNLQAWQHALKTLTGYNIASRPVYKERTYIEAMIRSKVDMRHEAYVLVYVKPEDLIAPAPGKTVTDKLGHSLLTLKEHAVRLENIAEFVHMEQVYRLVNGQLVK